MTQDAMLTGHDLLAWCDKYNGRTLEEKSALCLGYIEGFMDAAAQYHNAPSRPAICHPGGGTSYAQYLGTVVKYLRAHPERLSKRREEVVMDALKDAFPCK